MKMINTDKMIINYKKTLAKTVLCVLFMGIFSGVIHAQQSNLPIGEYYKRQIDFELNKGDISTNTAFKPLIKSKVNKSVFIDSVIYDFDKRDAFFENHKKNIVWRKLLFEDFISVEKKNFSLYVNPLFYMEKGMTPDAGDLFINTRGIELKGNIGEKISYYSSFRENQARFRSYIHDWAWDRLVVPGQGAFKKNNNDLTLLDFSGASAYLSYSPKEWLNIQAGQDKHFLGEGHRSLLLSANSFSYPFLRISADYKNLNYTTLFTEFRDFENAYYDYHTKKHGAFNYLSYNYKNRIEIGLFEGIIYRTTDTSEYVNKFKSDFFIPVIGLRTGINGFDSEHNAIVGINTKIKISDYIQIYGQTAIDDPKQRKTAYQGGLKIFDAFLSKLNNQQLFIMAEFNYAQPRTYSHQNIKFQTWSHYNQELAHPAGSDFKEYFLEIRYSILNFSVNYNYIDLTLNNKNTFSDIYITDDNNYLNAPLKESITHHKGYIAYTINPRTGLQLYAGADFRKTTSNDTHFNKFYMFGLRTRLSDYSYDF